MIELITTEPELLEEFVHTLAMCELLNIYSLIEPSMAQACRSTEQFVQDNYFDTYKQFITWWDATIVPYINELHEIATKRSTDESL